MSDTPIEAPTPQQLHDEIGFESVSQETHTESGGDYVTEVFCRAQDDTYWRANYFVSGNGYIHSLRSDEYCNPPEITQVKPVPVTTIKYTPVK
jgi:hypothetical protein